MNPLTKTWWVFYAILVVIVVTLPVTVGWWVDNKWRLKMKGKCCAICQRSWWRHHRKGTIVTCPENES